MVIQAFQGKLPMQIDYEDRSVNPGEKVYYRMDMKGKGKLVSNPIFVKLDGIVKSFDIEYKTGNH